MAPTSMEASHPSTILRPAPVRFSPLRAFAVVAAVICLATVMVTLARVGLSVDRLLNAVGVMLVVTATCFWLDIEGRRPLSVELSQDGLAFARFGLGSSKVHGLGLVPDFVSWEDVTDLGIGGHVVYVKSSKRTVAINTLLFKQDAAVIDFINERMARAKRA